MKKQFNENDKMVEDFKDLQISTHYRQSDQTNKIAKLSALKINILIVIITIFLTWSLSNYKTYHYGTILYNNASTASLLENIKQQHDLILDLSEIVQPINISTVWFDRKRQNLDESFEIVDNEFPAGYEIWRDEQLVERWHWKIIGNKKTDQFGNYIYRCIANYNDKNEYVGFTQTLMSNYPANKKYPQQRDTRTKDSFSYTLNIKEQTFLLESKNAVGEGMGILWSNGGVKHTYLVKNGFKYDQMEGKKRKPHLILKNIEQIDYIKHIATKFEFLTHDLIDPYNDVKI